MLDVRAMRIEVSGHNISFDPGTEWVLQEPYSDREVQQRHGVYLRSSAHGIDAHVRGYAAVGFALNLEGLLAMLRNQGAAAPVDEETMVLGPLTIVAGTFETPAFGGTFVREFFITDGEMQANAAAIGSREALSAAKPAIEALVTSIRFESS